VASKPLIAKAVLEGTTQPGHYGLREDGAPQLVITERRQAALAYVVARSGLTPATAEALSELAGAAVVDAPYFVTGADVSVLGCAPGQWMVFANSDAGRAALASLPDSLAACATATDQTGAKVMVTVGGPRAAGVLAKGCQVDLHEDVFVAGSAATTQIDHIVCQLWMIDGAPTYGLLVNRSLAQSLWSWLATSAAEYGYEVAAP
jgi:methylglutamate dehydrogenase subunit D